jgi:hypothetical protein
LDFVELEILFGNETENSSRNTLKCINDIKMEKISMILLLEWKFENVKSRAG